MIKITMVNNKEKKIHIYLKMSFYFMNDFTSNVSNPKIAGVCRSSAILHCSTAHLHVLNYVISFDLVYISSSK